MFGYTDTMIQVFIGGLCLVPVFLILGVLGKVGGLLATGFAGALWFGMCFVLNPLVLIPVAGLYMILH